ASVYQQKKDFGKHKQQLKVKEISHKGKQVQSSQAPRLALNVANPQWRVHERQGSVLLLQATRAYEA
ncbi:hypothetical protein A2U01_0093959, partial [Trifolium medium]|nr:hypothetical protein [Trifolium medium]